MDNAFKLQFLVLFDYTNNFQNQFVTETNISCITPFLSQNKKKNKLLSFMLLAIKLRYIHPINSQFLFVGPFKGFIRGSTRDFSGEAGLIL